MNLKNIYLRYKLIFWPVFSGLASVLILALVIVPQILGFVSMGARIKNLGEQSDSLEAKASELVNIDEQKSRKDLLAAFSVLPIDMDIPQAATILQNLIIRNGLVLKNTVFAGGKTASSKKSYQLNISVAGDLLAVRNFLISLQDAPRVFQVESINIQFQKSKSDITADIPITVFYEPQKNVSSRLEQAVPKLNQEEEELLSKLSRIAYIVEDVKPPQPSSGSALSPVPLGKPDPFE